MDDLNQALSALPQPSGAPPTPNKKWGVGRWLLVCALVLIPFCGIKMVGLFAGLTTVRDDAERAVHYFHAQIAAGRCDAIYQAASETFTRDITGEQFTKLCTLIPKKLGAAQSDVLTSWRVNSFNSGDSASLQLNTKFEKGSAEESFDFFRRGGEFQLVRYRINSPQLLAD